MTASSDGSDEPSPGGGTSVAPKRKTPLADALPRIISALVMGTVALFAAFHGGQFYLYFWLLGTVLVHWEWQTMIGAPHRGWRFVVGAVALCAAGALNRQFHFEAAFATLGLGAVLLAWLAGPGRRLWAAAGIAYAGVLIISMTLIEISLLNGRQAVLWLFAVVWGADVMAYFGGRKVGGAKLWPRISPGKTWSGFIIGIVSGALFGVLTLLIFPPDQMGHLFPIFLLGLCAAVVAQGGDLFESALKRHFGLKDSGSLIPGHGGFMDRLDGFIAAAAFAALVGVLHLGPGQVAIGLLRW